MNPSLSRTPARCRSARAIRSSISRLPRPRLARRRSVPHRVLQRAVADVPEGRTVLHRQRARVPGAHRAEPKLAQEIRGFIGQEAIHSREHEQTERRDLPARGYDATLIDSRIDRETHGRIQISTPITRLARHRGHRTPDRDPRQCAADQPGLARRRRPAHGAMWRWHAIEEVEHKAVAFDTYVAAAAADACCAPCCASRRGNCSATSSPACA